MWNSVNREHGPYRRPMGGARSTISSAAAVRWTWPTLARHARRGPWGALGVAHRRSLARSAESLSALSDLSSPLSALAAFWSAVAIAPEPRRGLTRPRQARSERSVCRRQLQLGEKRGSAIGPTRRGKGSKIMAISDGHGLPVAIHVASASPHEVTLVDATLAASFLDTLPTRLIGDRGYDSDRLDAHLRATYGIEMIARHSRHRRTRTQDGRPLR